MAGRAHVGRNHFAALDDDLVVEIERAILHRQIEMAGGVVVAAELGVGPEREQHIAIMRAAIHADAGQIHAPLREIPTIQSARKMLLLCCDALAASLIAFVRLPTVVEGQPNGARSFSRRTSC